MDSLSPAVTLSVPICLLVLLFGTCQCLAGPADTAPARLVAVGDVHGDFDAFCSILRRAALLNEQNHWVGGTSILVQTGDVIDRGPKSREAMDLLMRMEKEAADAGGKVMPLLGNHEVMNIIGDLRYVPAQEYASFTDADSEKRRHAAYQEYAAWRAYHEKFLAALKQPTLPATEEEWIAVHPAGFVEFREAFSSSGLYGKWLRTHAAVAKVGSVLLLHGGISPDVSSMSVDQINAQVRKELEDFDKTAKELIQRKAILPFFTMQEMAVGAQAELMSKRAVESGNPEYHNMLVRFLSVNSWLCMKEDGPLWFRAYDRWSDEEGAGPVDRILSAYNAKHMVVSHTVQKTAHIRSRFGGKVFLIDTGMLSSYWPGGMASALEVRDGKFTGFYLDGQELLLDEKATVSAGGKN